MKKKVVVAIPNINGAKDLAKCIESVLNQSFTDFDLVIVDNASTDESPKIIQTYANKDKRIRPLYFKKNYGYTGGVNPAIKIALQEGSTYVATFNNDAIAHKDWLKHLVAHLDANPKVGGAACSLQNADGSHYDSTGDIYTTWGLPYPRGRLEPVNGQYDQLTSIFGASGGASLFRVSVLRKVGGFDQDFFAYGEDIDLSFRIQLAGNKVAFVPKAIVYHAYNSTSSKIKGFTTFQTIKNYPWIIVKDVPAALLPGILPRFLFAYCMFIGRAFTRGQGWWAVKGFAHMVGLLPKKLVQRRRIQKNRKVSAAYISSILTHDLPPNAHKLRALRSWWQRLWRTAA